MNHAITTGGFLGTLGIIVGALMVLAGGVSIFGGTMSDAPEAGDNARKTGCYILVVAALVVAGSLAMLL